MSRATSSQASPIVLTSTFTNGNWSISGTTPSVRFTSRAVRASEAKPAYTEGIRDGECHMKRQRLLGLVVVATLATVAPVWSVSAAPVVKNLIVTPAVRHNIFVALAAFHQLPTKDYV